MKKKQAQTQVVEKLCARLSAFQNGDGQTLWAAVQSEIADPPLLVETRAATRARVTPSVADQGLLRRVRNSLAEGSPGRALRQLMSDGIHSAQDPLVWAKLQELHPEPLVPSRTALPGVVDPGVESEEPQALWDGLVRDAIARFPKGTAPGPSGLRASHLQDAVRRPGRGAPLV